MTSRKRTGRKSAAGGGRDATPSAGRSDVEGSSAEQAGPARPLADDDVTRPEPSSASDPTSSLAADSGAAEPVKAEAAAIGDLDGQTSRQAEPDEPHGTARGDGEEATPLGEESGADGEEVTAGPAEPTWFIDEPPEDALPPRYALPAARPMPAVPASRSSDPRSAARTWLSGSTAGIAVLLVLAVVCAGLVVAVVIKTGNDAAVAEREAAAYTPPPLSSATPSPTGPSIAVIGDETALRAADGVDAAERWPQVLADDLSGRVSTSAAAGAGYATDGSGGSTFAEVAETVSAESRVVVFVGGAGDAGVSNLSLARSATQAFSAAAEQAPDAVVLAIGPLYRPTDVDAEDMTTLRTTLQSAARVAGVRWVDPIRSGWLDGVDGTDGLTASAERVVASRMRSVVASALE